MSTVRTYRRYFDTCIQLKLPRHVHLTKRKKRNRKDNKKRKRNERKLKEDKEKKRKEEKGN